MQSRIRLIIPIPAVLLLLGGFLLFSGSVNAKSPNKQDLLFKPVSDRPGPPPTVYPPSQADNGAQVFWGICQDCHGNQGQGLTATWRSAFAPEYQDCWASGCHGEDPAPNSFTIPVSGVPALAGPGALPQFSTAFELGSYIYKNMPLSPTGSLSSDQAWELTAYLLSLNSKGHNELTLSGTNSAAIPVHREIDLPESQIPGVLLLSGVLILAAVGISLNPQFKSFGLSNSRKATFIDHLHPPRIPAVQARFGYTLGAGGLSVFFCLVLLVTGLLEMYYYLPTPESAATSIQTLSSLVPYGQLIRNLHYWSAQLLVITTMIHLVRVILTGAYAPPRQFNYLLGIILLVLVLLLDFTGYVLRWDEGVRWALVVGTNLLKTVPWIGPSLYLFVIGGDQVGPAALTRFYAWHIFGLTLLAGGITGWHIFRVRRDGGIGSPPPGRKELVEKISRTELLRKEILALLIAGAVLLTLSVFTPAPIGLPITESGGLIGDSRAPWFFLWIQKTLQWGSPFLWGVGAPLLVVGIFGLLPYLLPNAKEAEWGRWLPAGNRIAQVLTIIIIAAILFLTVLGWVN